MGNYKPHHGERCRITVDATYRVTGPGHDRNAFDILRSEGRGVQVIDSDLAVAIEPLPQPALPTTFGARIMATRLVGAHAGKRTELVCVGDHWVAANELAYGGDDLSDVEVLYDPGALHGVAESEPLELPTGFGAVVSATYEGETAMAVRADPLSPASWFVSLPRSRTRWASDDELTRAVILGPGIDVDIP